MIFADKVDVIDSVICSQAPFDPIRAAIVSIGKKAAIAANPAAF